MRPEVLTDPYLDSMRQEGDETADEIVARIFAFGDREAVNRVMHHLVTNDQIRSGTFSDLPQELEDYSMLMDQIPLPDAEATRIAQQTFAEHGPEILMVLGFYSLPASYAAKRGVQVLHRTARLVHGPLRRVFETSQMVIDVLLPGGLLPSGRGLATIRKVRLMHAAIRHLLQSDTKTQWDASLGRPINQEDLAGTLMTFSYLIVEGMERLGASLTADQSLAWIRFWGGLGPLLGVKEELIPSSVEEARALTRTIQKRQIDPSPEGRELTRALIEMYQQLIPGRIFDGFAPTLMRELLPPEVADGLGVPKSDFTQWIWKITGQALECALTEEPFRKLVRSFNLHFLEAMLAVERKGERPPFDIPDQLADGWREA